MAGSSQDFCGNGEIHVVPDDAENREIRLKVKAVKRLTRWDKIVKPFDVSYRLRPAAR